MKFSPLAALMLASVAVTPVAAIAQDEAEAPAAAFTIDTPIETLMADEAAKGVLVKHLGAMDQHPAYGQFKAMSLVELKPWSQGMITDEILEKISNDLAAL